MSIDFNPYTKKYDLSEVTETELQILHEAFYNTPFTDIPGLHLYSARIAEQLRVANAALIERYNT